MSDWLKDWLASRFYNLAGLVWMLGAALHDAGLYRAAFECYDLGKRIFAVGDRVPWSRDA
jgi:hypothetical protein